MRQYLRPVLSGLALLYALYAVLHVFLLDPADARVLSSLAAGSALVFGALRLAWPRLPARPPWPNAVGSGVALLALGNVLVHLVLTQEPRQTTLLMILVLGSGVLLLSTRWLAGVLLATAAGWCAAVTVVGLYDGTGHYAISLLTAGGLSVILHLALRRATIESERRRLSAERLQDALLDALHAEADTRAALEDAMEEAREMNQLQAAFLANLSHEIRTPLTSIIGFSEILSEKTSGDANHFASLIQQSGRRLLETINSVLDLSKLKADDDGLHPQLFDASSALRDTADLFRERAGRKDLDLDVALPDAPLTTRLDLSAFNRVSANLIGNAVKFCDTGERVHVLLDATDDVLTLQVEDTGPGIHPNFRDRLFEPFQRDEVTDQQGTGLGLTITQRLVTLMGGTIEVDSTLGEGTTFTVRLPRWPEAEDAANA